MKVGDQLEFKPGATDCARKGLKPEMEIVRFEQGGHFVELVHHKADGSDTIISTNIKTLEECCRVKSSA
jgi:hypothetical protein